MTDWFDAEFPELKRALRLQDGRDSPLSLYWTVKILSIKEADRILATLPPGILEREARRAALRRARMMGPPKPRPPRKPRATPEERAARRQARLAAWVEERVARGKREAGRRQ